MVEHTLVVLKKRDRLEAELGTFDEIKKAAEKEGLRMKDSFDLKLELYKKWKEENQIAGIKF